MTHNYFVFLVELRRLVLSINCQLVRVSTTYFIPLILWHIGWSLWCLRHAQPLHTSCHIIKEESDSILVSI